MGQYQRFNQLETKGAPAYQDARFLKKKEERYTLEPFEKFVNEYGADICHEVWAT